VILVFIEVTDPWCNTDEAESICGIKLIQSRADQCDAIELAVAHDQFHDLAAEGVYALGKENHVFMI